MNNHFLQNFFWLNVYFLINFLRVSIFFLRINIDDKLSNDQKRKNVWKIFLSVFACSFCAKYFLKIKYFQNYVLKFMCGGVI